MVALSISLAQSHAGLYVQYTAAKLLRQLLTPPNPERGSAVSVTYLYKTLTSHKDDDVDKTPLSDVDVLRFRVILCQLRSQRDKTCIDEEPVGTMR